MDTAFSVMCAAAAATVLLVAGQAPPIRCSSKR